MIRFVTGNILESKAQTLVNTVNCVGVMGKGLAKAFRDQWPEMYREYQAACRRRELRSGKPFLWRDLHKQILCLPTKDNWKGSSKYEFIEAGLEAIRQQYRDWNIKSLAVPPLGCGLGGLEWDKVRALIEKHLGDLPLETEVYEPMPADLKIARFERKRVVTPVNITLPLAIVGEIIRRARAAMPPAVSLGKLLVHKFAFFAQLAGAPIRLKFSKEKYGPYDHNLNHMIERLEGLYIRDESASWKRSDLRMLDEPAWYKAIQPLADELKPYSKYIDASVDLLKGRPLDEVELLATVQYAWCDLISAGLSGTDGEIGDYIHSWSREKQDKFSSTLIGRALSTLQGQGWLGPGEKNGISPLLNPAPQRGTATFV